MLDVDRLRAAVYDGEIVDPDDLDAIAEALAAELEAPEVWVPQDYQLPPPGNWWAWVFSAGAGAGKTDTGAYWFNQHMTGPACDKRIPGGHKGLIAGPTTGDALTTCWGFPAGIHAHNPAVQKVGRTEGTTAVWPNGAEALFAGMHSEHDVNLLRARAANCCAFWLDDAAVARHLELAVDLIQQRARGGPSPHGIVTSTPRPTPGWRHLVRLPDVVVTHASAYQNRYLSGRHKQRLERFQGTRLGRQEIHGELLDDYEGALFSRDVIDADRVRDRAVLDLEPAERLDALGIVRVGVGIDPSTWIPEVGAPDDQDYEGGAGIETGLVVAGIDRRSPPHVYVLDDLSGRLPAQRWARRACDARRTWRAAWVVPETNAGGDMVLATLRLTDPAVTVYREPGSNKPGVRASVGKRARAEPVGLLSEQHRLHMVGEFPALESTLTSWDPTENWSPDRLDALVWAVTALRPWRHRGPARATTVAGRQVGT